MTVRIGLKRTLSARNLPVGKRKQEVSDKLLWQIGKDAQEQIYRETDCWNPEGSRGGSAGQGNIPRTGLSGATYCQWKSKYGGIELR